ncbi:MAG: hypothetical protein L6R38_008823 [Xanthoria sp. 2 TBL-2021]|nr:MAG: hypothetical protein L6R38_008823 [Xanthoria sp. 2 TBL-2021]
MAPNPKLNLFPQSKVWDERTQKKVDALGAHIHREPQPTISQVQQESIKGRLVNDDFHCFQDTLSPPGNDVKDLLLQTIDQVKKVDYQSPERASFAMEWIGRRLSPNPTSKDIPSNQARWNSLANEARSPLTILHVHGGAFLWVIVLKLPIPANNIPSQGSPDSYRPSTTQLASLTGGRVVSVKYRLAPQTPFPAALLDILAADLSLLFPHPSSAHAAIEPSSIVFPGDSYGGIPFHPILQIAQHTSSHPPIKSHSHTINFQYHSPQA